MATMNRCEAEIDAIRDKIMEETKHLTREENKKRLNEQAQSLAAQYGFKIGKPSSGAREIENAAYAFHA